MNQDIKYLLDEMSKHFDDQDALIVKRLVDHDTKLEQRFVDHEGVIGQRLSDLDSKWGHRFATLSTDTAGRVSHVETAAANMEEWRQEMEASVEDMHLEVKKLSKHWDRAVMDQATLAPGIMGATPSAAVRPPAGSTADTASGHRQEQHHRVDGFGVITTLLPHPVKGMRTTPPSPTPPIHHTDDRRHVWESGGDSSSVGRLPKLQFPMKRWRVLLGVKMRDVLILIFLPITHREHQSLCHFLPRQVNALLKIVALLILFVPRRLKIAGLLFVLIAGPRGSVTNALLSGLEIINVLNLFNFMCCKKSWSCFSQRLTRTLSIDAIGGSISGHSFCLQGDIQHLLVVILVDSGSSHTLLSSTLASRLVGVQSVPSELEVQVANGQILQCTAQLPQLPWSVQGCQFQTDVKVLTLSSYDMILGLDWLSSFSPMRVHWHHKWMSIPYHGSNVLLLGDNAVLPKDSLLHIYSVDTQDNQQPVSPLLPAVQLLLDEFSEVFAVPNTLPPPRSCDHRIPLIPGAAPVNIRPYRLAPALKNEVEMQVKEMLDNGFIQKSSSPFSSSVLLVKKKDNTWCFCVDYRQLNAITVKGKYPVPIIDELLDELVHAKWFSKLDLRSGFHQVRLSPGEEYKTAFQTHMGHYEFCVMPFGLTGAPGTFQDAMNSTLAPYLRQFVLVFFDDILIYSPSLEDHLHHLRLVFELLAQDSWKVKLSKCEFAQQQIHYLGHVISSQGVSTDPNKVSAIAQWPIPSSVKELRSFLGLVGYYHKFVPHFGIIAQPLTALLKKHAIFVWTADHTASFMALQQALCLALVLALPDFSLPFVIETDASGHGIGAVLMQQGHPIAYISKALGPRSQGLSTYEKEYMAILMAIQQWRSYLQHNTFHIFTDQKSLIQLSEQRLHTPWQQKVFTKLLGLDYKLVYKKGVDNRVADALSRHPNAPLQCAAVTTVTPQWISQVQDGYPLDPDTMTILSKLSIDPQAVPGFELQNGILRFHKRIWIGHNPSLQQQLLSACHASAVGGHSGIPVTYMRMKQMFAWKGMKRAVQDYVQTCITCQQAKPDRSKLPGLLAPLPVPSNAWQVISMDFVEGLPLAAQANCILVVVDSFTKYAHFLPLHHPFTASSVARVFVDNIYKLHGMPTAIISDRD
ncbi:hypothetical protein U9M48_036876 [Paspalum notatum var. saurae]|uniref:Reverse transcriptase n=1 Tax=Paspalum notatum var. saurae TaxID=547442 RepID=A0AAQ3UFB4_PASNO